MFPTARDVAALVKTLCFACGAVYWDANEKKNLPKVDADTLEIIYRGVSDVPLDVLRAGFARVAGQHRYGNLPNIGTIRAACVDAVDGDPITAAEGWVIASAVMRQISVYAVDASRALIRSVRPDVKRIVDRFGWYVMKDMPSEQARREFMSEWEKSREARVRGLGVPGKWPAALCQLANVPHALTDER